MTPQILIPILWLALLPVAHATQPQLSLVATWASSEPEGTEILSYQHKTRILAVSNSEAGKIDLVSLARPNSPMNIRALDLELSDGHTINSVALHPDRDVVAVAVAGPVGSVGEIQLLNLHGKVLARYATGHGPDDVHFSPSGEWLAVANEAEEYWAEGRKWYSHPGSVTLIDLTEGLLEGIVREVRFEHLPQGHGLTTLDAGRFLEREIDDEEVEIRFDSGDPAHLEPEYTAFAPDEATVYVSLQENNGIAVVDTASATVRGIIALGVTEHMADLDDDGRVSFTETLRAFREPDQIAVTPDGRYLVTADEGDTDPKASKTRQGPAGGGRTLSVVDLAAAEVIGDTGNQLDEAAHAAGIYPDGRSDNKGSEPEGVITFEAEGRAWAIVALERADALVLVDLEEPSAPQVREILSLRGEGDGKLAPEGIVVFEQDGVRYVATANEKAGTVSIVAIEF